MHIDNKNLYLTLIAILMPFLILLFNLYIYSISTAIFLALKDVKELVYLAFFALYMSPSLLVIFKMKTSNKNKILFSIFLLLFVPIPLAILSIHLCGITGNFCS